MYEVTAEQRRIQQALWAAAPPPDHTVEVQLNVEGDAAELAELAYEWAVQLTRALAPAADMAKLPVVEGTALKRLKPGDEYVTARVERERRTTRVLSDKGLAWLRAELADMPREVHLTFARVSGGGRPVGGPQYLAISPVERSPGWLRLSGYLRESAFTDPATQRKWLTALCSVADLANPGYGQIAYYRGMGETAIENTMNPHVPGFVNARRDSDQTIGRSREILRGHDWLTIVPEELAAKLGGASALAATGAFAEVRALDRGGVALLATPTFQDYDLAAAEGPFRALAPVLPPGRPMLLEQPPWMPPPYVIDQDPSGRISGAMRPVLGD
ncbi:hypothetical protein [Actinoplanes solisilvae]|uniref:hypothetical protein n=1 Tax=Actinoplanes solisilvae TaxID=2486853 RepID=UPI000FDA32E1|nr:hypothetical protein [Actinoplanes solisilvae]